jgi:antitoxin (DNA-binding transcriptional repressor) of toxin-antitoxin stability system
MNEASFTELRNPARPCFDLVESGETVRVPRNGRPNAKFHPIARDLPSCKRRRAQPLLIVGEVIGKRPLEERGR